jgi:hypothetical protein
MNIFKMILNKLNIKESRGSLNFKSKNINYDLKSNLQFSIYTILKNNFIKFL